MSDSLREAMEPCPLCGRDPIVAQIDAGIGWWQVECEAERGDGCGLYLGRVNRDAAITAWNRRASTDAAPVAGDGGDLAEVKSELEWLVSLAKDSVETAHAVKEIDASAAKVIAALSQPPATDTAQAEPVGRDWFPILGSQGQRIDYQLVADHGQQAQSNHYQTVKRLKERGGLSWCELYAVLHNRKYEKIDVNDAMIACRALEARYLAALSTHPARTDEMRQLIDAAKAILADIADHPNAQRHLSGTKIMALGDAIAALSANSARTDEGKG